MALSYKGSTKSGLKYKGAPTYTGNKRKDAETHKQKIKQLTSKYGNINKKDNPQEWQNLINEYETETKAYKNASAPKPTGIKPVDAIRRIGQVSANTVMGAAPNELSYVKPLDTGSKGLNTTADVVGGITGFLGGAKGVGNLAGSKAGLIGKGLPAGQQVAGKLAQSSGKIGELARMKTTLPFVKKEILLGQNIIEGAVPGALMDVSQGLKEGDNAKELALRTMRGLAAGGLFDAGITALSPIAKSSIQKLSPILKRLPKSELDEVIGQVAKETDVPTETIKGQADDILLLPSPKPKEASAIKPNTVVEGNTLIQKQPVASPAKPLKFKTQIEIPESKYLRNQMNAKEPIEPKLNPIKTEADEQLIKSVESKISREVKPKKQKFSEVAERAKVQLTDRNAALERLEKQVKGKVDDATKSLYKQARLFSGVPEKASETVRTKLEPIIKSVEQQGYSYKDLGTYAEMVHARDVNVSGLKSGFTNAEIEAVIRKYAPLEQARQGLIKYNDELIQSLADSGRITTDQLQAMRTKWKNYMPLNRHFDDDKIGVGTFIKERFSNPAQPIKALKGSDRQVVDPIESMIKNTYSITSAAEQNNVAKQLQGLADIDVDGKFIRRLSEGEEVGRKNVVTAYVDGNKAQYEVDPEVYKAMEGLNKQSSSLLINILAKPASVLRAGATLTPEFAARNPIRDIMQAYVAKGFNPITDFASGFASTIKKDELYSQFLKEKGGYGNLMSVDRTTNRKILKDIIKQPVTKDFVTIINPKSWIELLRKLSDLTETSTKVGMFKKELKAGSTPAEAAYQARDLMDFARGGTAVKEANKIVAFLNASIQGKSKIIRSIKEDPTGTTARMAKGLVIPALTVKALQYTIANEEQAKKIQDAPDWLKDTFYLIPIPGTNQIARIPKPFDLAVIANSVERFADYVYLNDKEAFDGFAKATLSEQMFPILPTIGVPITEGLTNTSLFRQAPIIPQREQYLPREQQFDVNTSEASKQLAKLIRPIVGDEGLASNFGSPRIVDNAIRGYTAGLGNYTMDLYDYISGKTGISGEKTKPKKQLNIPVLGQTGRAFLVNDMSSGKSMNYVYSEYDKLNRRYKGKENLTKTEQKNMLTLKAYKDVISDISSVMREVQNSKDYSAEEKRKLLLDLNKQRNDLALEAKEKTGEG